MSDHDVVDLRAGRAARLVAWVMLVGATTLVLLSAIVGGVRGLGTVVVGAPLGALATAVIRMRVHASPEGLVVDWGLRRRVFSWDRIQGFRIEDAHGQRRVHVLVDGDQTVPLPIANGGSLLTSRGELAEFHHALVDAQAKFRT